VEIEVAGAPLETGYCHCSSCRAYSGGPVSAFILWRSEQVRVTQGATLIGRFNKVGMSERTFCTKCGGHLLTRHPSLGVTDVRPAVLPGIAFKPFVHLNYAETVLRTRDGLLKLKDFPATADGSGEALSE
jgi:hypothetical protein